MTAARKESSLMIEPNSWRRKLFNAALPLSSAHIVPSRLRMMLISKKHGGCSTRMTLDQLRLAPRT